MLRRRRPSAATLIALLALFVALGGPAEARKLFTGKDIKNRSLGLRELSRPAIKQLKATPRGSITERSLANGAVSSGKLDDAAVTTGKIAPAAVDATRLAPNSVGARELLSGGVGNAQIADNSVTSAKVPDSALDARDITRFSGRFRITAADVPPVSMNSCWSGEPVDLAPELANADISSDLVLVTPDSAWPESSLAFTVRNSANRSRFVLAACNVTNDSVDWPSGDGVAFRYVVIDLP